MLTRREFGKLALAGVVVGRPEGRPLRMDSEAAINSTVNGVRLGAQTYSFRELKRPAGASDSVDILIGAMKEAGVSDCELWAPQVEPEFPTGARGRRGDPPSLEAVSARVGLVDNSPPTMTPQIAHKTDILNPVIGGLYGLKLSPFFKLGLFLGVTLPVGSGGGTNTSLGKKGAIGPGINTRSAFDNAMFAIDYFTVFPGVDFAFVGGGSTVQAEATVFKLTKVRGPAASEDDSKVNFTTGLHAGYFLTPFLSVGAELRHQRWLSTPNAVKAQPICTEVSPRSFVMTGAEKEMQTRSI